MERRTLIKAAGAACATALAQPTFAQARYPTKAVRLVIPFAPGQGSDVLARAMSERLTASWGQQVVVDNKSGANGSIAAQEVARSAPDGHTLLFTSNSPIVINPNLYKKLPYSVDADLRPVALLSTTELALLVGGGIPAGHPRELVAHLQANPGKYSYGSPGAGSTSHLCMEAFKQATKTNMVHVPYRGSAPAMTDLMAGNIQLMMDGFPSSVPHVQSGRVKALAVTGASESGFLPGVPTLSATVAPGLQMGGWYGVLAPAATDPQVVAKLNADFTALAAAPEFGQRFKSIYMDAARPMPASGFGDLIKRETAMWERTVRALGLYQSE